MIKWFVSVIFLLLFFTGKAQVSYHASYLQSIQPNYTVPKLPVLNDSTEWSRPKKATVLAMVLPGAGQLYNKKFVKAGIVYAGFGGLVYSYMLNRDSLSTYQSILVNKIDGDSNTIDNFPQLTTAGVTRIRDSYRRNRDVTIIGFVALYALQIIDANVDAHLREFDVNEDLVLRISPDIMRTRSGMGTYNGLTLTLRLK